MSSKCFKDKCQSFQGVKVVHIEDKRYRFDMTYLKFFNGTPCILLRTRLEQHYCPGKSAASYFGTIAFPCQSCDGVKVLNNLWGTFVPYGPSGVPNVRSQPVKTA